MGHLGETGTIGEQGEAGFVGPKGSRGTIGPVVRLCGFDPSFSADMLVS